MENEEKLLGRIEMVTDQKWGSTNTLHVTNKRIIVETVISSGKKAFMYGAGGIFGIVYSIDSAKKKTEKMIGDDRTFEQILNSHKKNYSISNEDIQKVILKKKIITRGYSRVTIKSKRKKYMLAFPRTQFDDVKDFMSRIYSDKIEIK